MDDNTIVYDDGFKRLVFVGMVTIKKKPMVKLRLINHVNTSCWATAEKAFPLKELSIMRLEEILQDDLQLSSRYNKVTVEEDGETCEGLTAFALFIHRERVRLQSEWREPVSDNSIFHLTSLFEDVTTLIEERKKGDD